MADETDDRHWIEIVDGQGLYPAKRLGPYASARLADRAGRGAMRLLNARRYTITILPERDLESRSHASHRDQEAAPAR